jgi:hypothetical protein
MRVPGDILHRMKQSSFKLPDAMRTGLNDISAKLLGK